MESFNFLPQSSAVERLLNACRAMLTYLPASETIILVAAMREFENFGAPVLWSAADVDTDEVYGLSEGEKREAMGRFIQGYECKESDWLVIDGHARDVLAERRIPLIPSSNCTTC